MSLADDDTMNGGDGDDVLVSVRGNDFMDGGDGDDTFLLTGSGLKTVFGGAGDDHVFSDSFPTASVFPPMSVTNRTGNVVC